MRDITELGSKLARGPMRGSVGRFALCRPRQHARFDLIGHFVAFTPGGSMRSLLVSFITPSAGMMTLPI